MRRLTLILSDLFLPSDADPEEARIGAPPTHELPALEALLRIADSPKQVGDWRAFLLGHHAYESESSWLATPVALEVRLDHVRLVDRGLLRLDEADRTACREEFARVFGPQYVLEDGGERSFLLSGLPKVGVPMSDPARLLGSEIGPALPPREAGEFRRLWTEIEMWLNGAAFNAARERAGRRRVSALWLWNPATPSIRARVEPGREAVAFYGGDSLITALNRQAGARLRVAPAHWTEVDISASEVVIEFAPMTGGPHEALSSLETNWFAPARQALSTGQLADLELLANDRLFRIGARARFRFWRGRRSWLAQFGKA